MSGVERATSAPVQQAAAVIGSGAWGTTFASLLAQAGTPTTIWARRREMAEEINAGTNERYVPGHRLPPGLKATTDLAQAVTEFGACEATTVISTVAINGAIAGAHRAPRPAARSRRAVHLG